MKTLALLVALVIIIIGIVLCVIAPDQAVAAAPRVLTPAGLYSIAALRVGMGLVLILVAPRSRAPRALRVLGVVVLAAGLATPAFGVDRARAVVDWAATQGTAAILRGVGVLMLALGGFIAFAVAAGRRPA